MCSSPVSRRDTYCRVHKRKGNTAFFKFFDALRGVSTAGGVKNVLKLKKLILTNVSHMKRQLFTMYGGGWIRVDATNADQQAPLMIAKLPARNSPSDVRAALVTQSYKLFVGDVATDAVWNGIYTLLNVHVFAECTATVSVDQCIRFLWDVLLSNSVLQRAIDDAQLPHPHSHLVF